jgi:DNA transformation protein and related proteins
MLAEAGVNTLAELQQLGAVRAYRRVSQLQRGKASLNLLWALAAGLQDRDWRSLTKDEKDTLRRDLRATG